MCIFYTLPLRITGNTLYKAQNRPLYTFKSRINMVDASFFNGLISLFKGYEEGGGFIFCFRNSVNKKCIIIETRNIDNLVKRLLKHTEELGEIDGVDKLEVNITHNRKELDSILLYYYHQYEVVQGYSILNKSKTISKPRVIVRPSRYRRLFHVILVSSNGSKEVVGAFDDLTEAYEWARQYYHKSVNPFKYRVVALNRNTKMCLINIKEYRLGS